MSHALDPREPEDDVYELIIWFASIAAILFAIYHNPYQGVY